MNIKMNLKSLLAGVAALVGLTAVGDAAAALPAGVDRGGIRGVNVEADVTSIGSRFLMKCYNLNAFTGGANLVTFGERAFYLTIPAISLPGYKAVLYGTNDLSDPSGWRPVDQGQTMEEAGYHFFKYVLEKQDK